ncbi:zf-HC2 domain-containing protein [Paenibacillus sp. FSL R7-0302]|uniref:anti-sigma factor family protein n=1 Tax=Paenibacillus sp. FSL R7-0302 TaxID=2921681 RepID=UPI0030F6EA31
MKCAEVMEWMHRYLDHDLSQEEMLEMFRHIDDCPACAEVLDRLTLLSQQLEQLPDVKPPFSLVDSILPQLEQLDRGVPEEPAVMEPEDPKVIPFSRSNSRGKKSKGPSLAARTGIGAAAAAVILLIAVFNMPKSLPGADLDMSSNLMSSGAANSNMSTESSADAPQADGQNNSGGSSELRLMEQATPSDTADGDMKSAPPAPSEPADQPAAADGGIASDKVPAVSEAPISNRTATAPPADRPKSTKKADSQSAEPQSTKSIAPTQESMADDKAAAGDARMAPTPAPAEAGIMALKPADSAWTSPDGQHTAELTGQHVVIYSLTAEGEEQQRTVLTSLPLEGNWVSGVWSEDGTQFTYVLQLEDGTQTTKVYTVPAESATPAPSASPAPANSQAPTASPAASASSVPSPAITPDAATSDK